MGLVRKDQKMSRVGRSHPFFIADAYSSRPFGKVVPDQHAHAHTGHTRSGTSKFPSAVCVCWSDLLI